MKKTQRILATSDIHLTNKNSKFRYNSDGVSDLLTAQKRFIEMLVFLLFKEPYDTFVFAGDWTDYATLDPITQHYSNMLVRAIAQTGRRCIFVEGNHCITDDKNRFTVLSGLKEAFLEYDNMHFVTKEETLEFEDANYHVFPYSSDYERLEESISRKNDEVRDSDNTEIMLFHFPCVNALLDNGIKSKKGVALTEDISGNFDMCIGGDYHSHQWLDHHTKAFYVGAPFNLKFGEGIDNRNALEIVFKDGDISIDSIPNSFNYPMYDVTAEEVLQTSLDLERSIVRVKDWTEEDRIRIDKLPLYKVYYVKAKNEVEHEIEVKIESGKFDISEKVVETIVNNYEGDELKQLMSLYESVTAAF